MFLFSACSFDIIGKSDESSYLKNKGGGCNGQEKSDTTIERLLLFCSKQLGDKYPSFECSRT